MSSLLAIPLTSATYFKPAPEGAEKQHPEVGARLVQPLGFSEDIGDAIRHHHERFDGAGYPRGLAGEAIPLGARIFAVVDTFDAMTSDRPYRAACSIQDARDEVQRWAGRQFDPRVATAFLSIDEPAWVAIRERVHREVTAIDEQVKRVLDPHSSSA